MNEEKFIKTLSYHSGYSVKELRERQTEPLIQPYDCILAMKEYLSELQQNTKANDQHDIKALSIADVVRSYSKKDIISLLEDRKAHFKPKDYYKNERMRLTQAINTIKKLVPDF